MSGRAEALAERFEQVNNELIAKVEGCSDQQWWATCQGEGWSVGVTAHHVAGGNRAIAGFVQTIANGEPMPPITMEQIDQMNAQHAQEFANCTKAETLELLRSSGEAAAGMVRGLNDEQLDRSQPLTVMGGQQVSAQQFIEMVLIGHVQGHLQSINAAA